MHTHARTSSLYHSLSRTHRLIQTSGLTKAFVPFTSCQDSLCYPAQSFVTSGQSVPHTNKLVGMLNFAKTKTDAEDRHIPDFKRYICDQETSEIAKMSQSNVTKLTTTN